MRLALCAFLAVVAFAAPANAGNDDVARTKRLYDTYCNVCHGTGWQGAPLTGNAADWQPRGAKGWDAMLKNAQLGINGMPAKGTCEECSAADFRALIEMMMAEEK